MTLQIKPLVDFVNESAAEELTIDSFPSSYYENSKLSVDLPDGVYDATIANNTCCIVGPNGNVDMTLAEDSNAKDCTTCKVCICGGKAVICVPDEEADADKEVEESAKQTVYIVKRAKNADKEVLSNLEDTIDNDDKDGVTAEYDADSDSLNIVCVNAAGSKYVEALLNDNKEFYEVNESATTFDKNSFANIELPTNVIEKCALAINCKTRNDADAYAAAINSVYDANCNVVQQRHGVYTCIAYFNEVKTLQSMASALNLSI